MRSDLLSGRRLRFPIEMDERESIPGAISRGVAEHVLIRTAPVLEAAGVGIRHIGLAQIASPDELERLAYVARYPANDFVTRAGERLLGRDDKKSYEARFGRLVIPRAYLEFNRRRIAPSLLERECYHRASWMNALLPYCPESLERLVDECGRCKAPLGWFHSRGVECCDRCGQRVEASVDEPLGSTLADDYRFFALLSSPDARGVEEACGQLPPPLQAVSPGSLVRLALLIGGLVQPQPVPTTNRNTIVALPPATLAAAVSSGTAMLRSWPTGFRSWVANKVEELSSSPKALTTLRSGLKRIGDRQQEPAEIVSLVTDAFPDLQRHAAHSFGWERPYYLYKSVQNMLGLSSPAMNALKQWEDVKFIKLNDAGKEQGQFDVEQIDGLVPVFRDSEFMNACAQYFSVPIYAIEMLCAAGVLEWEDHPALLITNAPPKVRGSSIRRLAEEILRRARQDEMPTDCVSMTIASRWAGGRLKPWASIVEALAKGDLAFWTSDGTLEVSRFRVRLKDLQRFQVVMDAEAPHGFIGSRVASQEDAAEILNVAPKHLSELSGDLGIAFTRQGRGLFASLDAVLDAAYANVWKAEIAVHLAVQHNQVERILSARGILPRGDRWSRPRLMREGILPSVPAHAGPAIETGDHVA